MTPFKSHTTNSTFPAFARELLAICRNKVERLKFYFSFANRNKKFQETIDELTRQNALKDRLLAIVTHDIRAPLNSLRSLLFLLLNEDLSRQELEQIVLTLDGQVDQLSHFLENILRWTKNNSGDIKPQFNQLKLLPLVTEAVGLHLPQAKRKQVNIDFRVSENINVYADEEMIKVVLRNLISNAIKFSHPNSSIDIRANEGHETIMISVRDEGDGMSEEISRALFTESHASTRGTQNEIGIGIGLTLCQDFVKKMGGEIRVTSTEGIGSCFEFSVQSPKSSPPELRQVIEGQVQARYNSGISQNSIHNKKSLKINTIGSFS